MSKRRLWVRRVHLYIALITAIPLLFMSLTGTLLVYREPIEDYFAREYLVAEGSGPKKTLEEMKTAIKVARPEYELAGIVFPKKDEGQSYYFWRKDAPLWTALYVNPYTLEFRGERDWYDWTLPNLVWWLTDIHYSFKGGTIGTYFVGATSFIFFLSLLSGIYLWWPKNSKFTRYKFELRLAKRWKQTAYNLHQVVGVYTALALILISLTGITITFYLPMQQFAHFITLSPPPHVPPTREPTANQELIAGEQLIATAKAHLSKTYDSTPHLEAMSLPDAKNVIAELSFQGNPALFGADHHHVWVDAQTGEVIGDLVPSNFNRGEHLVSWIGPLHYGTWGAWIGPMSEQVTRVLWFIVSLVPIFFIVTGFSMLRKNFLKR